ncbi:MAG: cadmium resistance transporter, partial [Bdellovibrionia bacterium]
YILTNLDSLFILLFLANVQSMSNHEVIAGQQLGFLLVLGMSYVTGMLSSLLFPASFLPFLGLIPLLLGWVKLSRLFFKKLSRSYEEKKPLQFQKNPSVWGRVFLVTGLMVGSSSDNIVVYSGIFANQSNTESIMTCLNFLVLNGMLCWFGIKLGTRFNLREKLKNHYEEFISLGLILIGVLTLSKFWISI